jgi:hypothetical protein
VFATRVSPTLLRSAYLLTGDRGQAEDLLQVALWRVARTGAISVAQRDWMVQAICQLPRRQREVVVLRFLLDLSVQQTAAVLGASEGTVKSHTSRRLYLVPFLPPTAAAQRRLPRKYRTGGFQITTPAAATLQPYLISGNTITYFSGSADLAEINGGRAVGNGAYDTMVYNHPRQVIMVVPDGVAKVALWYPTRSIANHPEHPITPGSEPVIATVHDNIAAFTAPRRFERPLHGPFSAAGQEIWPGPGGNVVKRIDNANSCGPLLGACS